MGVFSSTSQSVKSHNFLNIRLGLIVLIPKKSRRNKDVGRLKRLCCIKDATKTIKKHQSAKRSLTYCINKVKIINANDVDKIYLAISEEFEAHWAPHYEGVGKCLTNEN